MPRRSVVDTSAHSAEIRHLLVDLQWGSRSVARYLELKYGEEIPAGTLRTWRSRHLDRLRKADKLPPQWADVDATKAPGRAVLVTRTADEIPDLLGRRIALAQMQEARIRLDLEHEFAMGKTFNSTVKEIETLNRVYDSIRTDMQELGLFPRADAEPTTQINVGAQAIAGTPEAAAARPLRELLPTADEGDRRDVGRALLSVVREAAVDVSSVTASD